MNGTLQHSPHLYDCVKGITWSRARPQLVARPAARRKSTGSTGFVQRVPHRRMCRNMWICGSKGCASDRRCCSAAQPLMLGEHGCVQSIARTCIRQLSAVYWLCCLTKPVARVQATVVEHVYTGQWGRSCRSRL